MPIWPYSTTAERRMNRAHASPMRHSAIVRIRSTRSSGREKREHKRNHATSSVMRARSPAHNISLQKHSRCSRSNTPFPILIPFGRILVFLPSRSVSVLHNAGQQQFFSSFQSGFFRICSSCIHHVLIAPFIQLTGFFHLVSCFTALTLDLPELVYLT